MPAPKCKEDSKKKNKKQVTQYDENGGWIVHQNQDELRKLTNPLFETYYRDIQQITGGDAKAFEDFVATMRTPLQTTLWINDCDPLAEQVSSYFSSLPESLATPIPWYPIKGMGWRLHTDKVQLRRDPANQALRQYMIKQTAMGTISRQEEVSMIPPFLLDIKENDQCLDMCASPGSKTAQMLVALGRLKKATAIAKDSPFPYDYLSEGFVVANELDTSRANMLVHQVKRLRTLFPFALFANHDARYFPELGTAEAPVKFDKILCDVVCSGDGTMRKSPFMFKSWSPREANKLQQTQVLIALRACYLLKVGGRMVYSTCSLNPIENEAVVSQIIARTGGAVKLVDGRSLLPNLACDPGLTTWKVTDGKGAVLDAPTKDHHEALFPLSEPPADMDLTKCMRLMPSHCLGGGFFVAVFEKVADWKYTRRPVANKEGKGEDAIDAELARGDEAPAKRGPRTEKSKKATDEKKSEEAATTEGDDNAKEGETAVAAAEEEDATKTKVDFSTPPIYVGPAPAQVGAIVDFYKLASFPVDNLIVRAPTGEREIRADPHSKVYMVSNAVRRVLTTKSDKVRIVSAGLRTLDNELLTGGWRISYEACPLFTKFFEKYPERLLTVSRDFVCELMVGGKLKEMPLGDIPTEYKDTINNLENGAFFMKVPIDKKDGGGFVPLVALRARTRVALFVDHEDLVELQLRMGVTEEELKAATERYNTREAALKAAKAEASAAAAAAPSVEYKIHIK